MASKDNISEEQLISQLVWRCEREIRGMVKLSPPPSPVALERESLPSSLGYLDVLPTEVSSMILNMLDLRSLSRVLRASFKGKRTVEALPAWQDIREHAPTVLPALGGTQLIKYHSISLVYQTLRESRCVSCFEFGGFLFMPTCERVCYECLFRNDGLWVVGLDDAEYYFRLTVDQLQQIPIMQTIPGTYRVRKHKVSWEIVCPLVSVKQAKKLAIEIHGSPEKLEEIRPKGSPPRSDMSDFNRFPAAPLEPPGSDMSRLQGPSREDLVIYDERGGLASLRFPSLTKSGADWGYLCVGCRFMYDLHIDGIMPKEVWSEHCAPGVVAKTPLQALQTKLYSRDEFPTHIQNCFGAQHRLEKYGRGRVDWDNEPRSSANVPESEDSE
ncbi:hypothetical protein FSARC_4012 [Fusarium sarcochroum]|uniref:F-box domain-containing protein n=1 Tax=Fusarium sarcochroum TaxID=1208366 RepID=A0A8H4U2T6_9HYPO|nr:hypothetical protein FSARC_4012 [Fusarium sarcochroum]